MFLPGADVKSDRCRFSNDATPIVLIKLGHPLRIATTKCLITDLVIGLRCVAQSLGWIQVYHVQTLHYTWCQETLWTVFGHVCGITLMGATTEAS